MRVLIVDNKSAHLERLKRLISEKLGKVQFDLCDPRGVTADTINKVNLVIISGGWGRSIAKNPNTFNNLIMLLAKHKKSTVGICLGAEAVAAAYGSSLTEMSVRRVGNIRIDLKNKDLSKKLGRNDPAVYEFHKWFVNNLGSELTELASSKDGVEIFCHKTLPIWATQFHPEVRRLDNQGHLIFEYILKELKLIS